MTTDARGFTVAVENWITKVDRRARSLFANVVDAAHRSIVYGSPLTGAPGQPVKEFKLKPSWKVVYESSEVALITVKPGPGESLAPLIYARFIEEGFHPMWGALTLRSAVGGFHSVKLTKANIDKIVAEENKKFAAEDGR